MCSGSTIKPKDGRPIWADDNYESAEEYAEKTGKLPDGYEWANPEKMAEFRKGSFAPPAPETPGLFALLDLPRIGATDLKRGSALPGAPFIPVGTAPKSPVPTIPSPSGSAPKAPVTPTDRVREVADRFRGGFPFIRRP